MLHTSPLIVDLHMSDAEYLQLLAQGIDPVQQHRDKSYELTLIHYGIAPEAARQVAPLLDSPYCSIAEKILVNQVLKQIWLRLTGQLCSNSSSF